MTSDMIVVLILVILAIVGLVYLERNSRRNSEKQSRMEKED